MKLKILVVDDNKESCETMMMLLKAYNHDAEAVFDGRSALERTLVWIPDVLLLDIGMPVMNGWEVAEALRKERTLDHVKIYALTGYNENDDIQRSFDSGMNYHFIKPLDIDDLWQVLETQGVLRNGQQTGGTKT